MSILSARCVGPFVVLALTAACGGVPAAPLDVNHRVELAGHAPFDLHLRLQPEHARLRERYLAAAAATLKQTGEWLGPLPQSSLVIVDPPWRAAPAAAVDEIVLERTPWWTAETSMTPELAVARALSRRAWARAIPDSDLPPWFVRGLVELSARRAIVPVFELENLSPGYAFLEVRFFGGFVPRFVRIRLLAESDGDPLSAYRARPAVNPAVAARSAADARSLEAKTVMALETLARWLSRPVFDQAIAEFVREARVRRATLADFQRVASEVSGQNLTWFFAEAFGSARVFDYGVAGLESDQDAGGTFQTTVVARRYGDALFTGSSAMPVGSFEAGRGVELLVQFADGQQRIDYWDGRAREKQFRYLSPARAISAVIDPDRTVVLDLQRTNNSRTLAPQAATAASIWSARYMIWLEDFLLTCASLG
jgi:hypothetical protein